MTPVEVYRYFRCQWTNLNRAVGFGPNSYRYWLTKGYIPMRSQYKIEEYTNGKLKAQFHPDVDSVTSKN